MDQIGRIPPHNEDAEKSVLGAVLLDKEVYYSVSEILKPEDFYNPAHKEIFTAMNELFARSEAIDAVTVAEALSRRKSLEACGGRSYIGMLSTVVPTTANASQYAKIVADKSLLRRLITASSSIVENSLAEKLDSMDILDQAEKSIFEIAKLHQSSDFEPIQKVLGRNIEAVKEAQKNGGQLPGLETGFKDLDRMTSGLQKSDLIILAARPSMGKTAFALNIAEYAALKKKARVVIFSLEMSKEQLGLRFLSMNSRVDSKKLRTGQLGPEDWDSIERSMEAFASADLIIDDTASIGVMEMRNKCRRITSEKKIDLIVIDYLQLMAADTKSESRQQEVTQISRYLKQLAREMECPVIVLSQLSRAAEKRQGGKRPMLSDLRESGAIEQDADIVTFLYRDDYYKAPDEKPNNMCEVIIAKQRNGEVGTINLTWIPQYTKFANFISESAYAQASVGN